jgi:two-component system sensor histidine kinase DesK
MVLTLGEIGTTAAVYVAVAAVMFFPLRVALALVLLDAALVVVLGETVSGWDSGVGLAFAVCASSVAIFGIQQMMLRNIALVAAHEENAELAVENERTRFARDLHDILGHSLTVITVKAELAQRLLDVDPERARSELADLERLSRDALSDVRRAVEGYRDLTLPGELTRARTALAAAGVEAHLPHAIDEVPTELRELFAWTVREGVTNVLRHSRAGTCTIDIDARHVEVRDDGRGTGESSPGSGITGLTERAAAVDAVVSARDLQPGFSLYVEAR